MAVIIQAALVLLWAGRAGARIDDLDARLQRQAPVAERLARLEEQAAYARAALTRIEDKLDDLQSAHPGEGRGPDDTRRRIRTGSRRSPG